MRKQLSLFLTLFLLLMGSGTAWANFWSNGVDRGTWTLTNFSDFSNWDGQGGDIKSWLQTNGSSRGWSTTGGDNSIWKTGGGETYYFEGANHLKVNGTVRLNINGGGLQLQYGASISVEVNVGYAVEITAQTAGRSQTYTWHNVRSTPQAPHFTSTSGTQTVLFNGTSTGWVTLDEDGTVQRQGVAQADAQSYLTITEIKMYPKPVMNWVKDGSQLSFDAIDFTKLDYDEPTLEMAGIDCDDVRVTTVSEENAIVCRTQSWAPDWNDGGKYKLTYDVMALRKGSGYVTATAYKNNQAVMSATYRVQVDVDQYDWEVQDKTKYILTGEGAILDPVVDAIQYMTMTFGNPINVPMVRNQKDPEDENAPDEFVATTIDQNGWRHIWMDNNHIPHQGTFYKFEPQITGELTIWMRLDVGKAVLIDAAAPTTAVKSFYSQGDGITMYGGGNDPQQKIRLEGGHTYYLYGITPNTYTPVPDEFIEDGSWAVAELNAFRFVPEGRLIYENKGVVYHDGKFYDIDGTTVLYNEPKQPIGDPGRVQYALEFYPDDSNKGNTSIANDGMLTIDPGFHGAIAVKAIVNNNQGQELNRDYYIVTVPYETYDWWFTESVDPQELIETRPSQGKQDFTTWKVTYKVLRPQEKWLHLDPENPEKTTKLRLREEVKDPVLSPAKLIHGNNAGYAIQTAGLLFDADPQRFGVNTDMSYAGLKKYNADGTVYTITNSAGIPIDQYLDELTLDTETGALKRDSVINQYAYYKTPADTYGYPTTYVTIATGTSLIIPFLQEGQHIRIYWARHNDSKGDKYTATGVTDLEGNDIDSWFNIGNGTGYTEFIAKGGNATFTLNDNTGIVSWTNIYRITVGEVGEFLDTGLDVRAGTIVYNPKPNIPGTLTTGDQVEYCDRTSYDIPSGSTFNAWGPFKQFNAPYSTIVNDNQDVTTFVPSSRGSTSSLAMEYKVVGNLGDAVTVDGNNISVKGNGIVGIVANGKSNGFVLDTDTLTMAYGNVDVQDYPHTWDFSKIGINTTTPSMLSNAYQNGFNISWYKNNTWGDPNTKNTTEYKMWESVENEYKLNAYQTEIKSTLFAQGSQLTANFVPIEETKGLGIFVSKNINNFTISDPEHEENCEARGLDVLRYGVTNGEGYLKFPEGEYNRSYVIRVPAVSKDKGERVYICADGTPAVYQESATKFDQLPSNTDGNNSYFEPVANGDVYIDVTNMKVFKIGVTSTFKDLKNYGSKSYATESRDHNERYDLSGYFTGNEVLAYKATGFTEAEERQMIEDDDNDGVQTVSAGKLTLEQVDVADANTGVVLIGQAKDFSELPLFVKDVNTDLTSNSGNLLKPVFANGNGDSNWGTGTNYILTRSYTTEAGKNVTGPLAFYKATNLTPSLDKYRNLAFLDLTGLISENGGNGGNGGNNGGNQTQTVEKNVTYALSAGDSFTSGQTVNVQNEGATVATITYGESGGNAFNAAVSDGHVTDFSAYTEGNGVNGNKDGGTFYTITPSKNGSIDVAVVLNDGKAFFIEEDGTALEGYNGITVSSKYYGTYTFNVIAGKSYKIYCSGSKLGFYGFKYTYNVEVPANAANYDMFWFIDEEEELDGIENISLEEILAGGVIETENAVYYNLSGQKLNGKPTLKGIYICNGKKIYVK